MRQIKIAMVLASLILAGCGAWNDLFGSKQSAATDPPNCSRAPLEVIIARAGMACSDTNPCPSGSYCNASAVCAWACYADSECATGQVCGCDGRCTGDTMSGPDGGAPTTDLSCNKNALLLYKIKPGFSPVPIPNENCDAEGHCPAGSQCDATGTLCDWIRECDNDVRCPAGSYCDPATGTCSWDCHPNVACPSPNQVCNCSGRCVIPGTSPGAGDPTCQARQAVTLGVSPRGNFVEGSPTEPPAWIRVVKLTLTAPRKDILVSDSAMTPATQTYVVPRANMQVFCNNNWISFPCALPRMTSLQEDATGWFVQTIGRSPDPVTVQATMLVQLRADPNVPAPTWHVDVFTPGAQNSPQAIDFGFDPNNQIMPGQPSPSWQAGPLPENASYRGTMIVTGPTDPDPVFSPTPTSAAGVRPGAVNIRAWSIGNQLHLFDPTHTISSSGTLVIQNGDGPPYYLVNVANARVSLKVHGNSISQILVGPGGALRGRALVESYDVDTVVVMIGDFSLTPIPVGQPVQGIPTEPPVASPSEPMFAASEPWLLGYQNAATTATLEANKVSSLWLANVYDYERGIAAPYHVSKPPMIEANAMLDIYPPKAGTETCFAQFRHGYFDHLNNLSDFVASDNKTYRVTATIPVYDVTPFCRANEVYDDPKRNLTGLPCIDGGVDWEPFLRANTSFNESASCGAMYANQAYSGHQIQVDYATWLAQQCFRVNGQMGVDLYNVSNNTHQGWGRTIYVCPDFKRSYVRVPDTALGPRTDASPGEAAFCYDPAHSGSTLLWSGNLTDAADAANTMEFSGDLLCRGPDGSTYAPRMFPLLTQADRAARGDQSATGADNASDLFDGCLRELRAPARTLGQSDLSSTAVGGTLLSLFSDATCVSVPRFAMAMDYYRTMPNPTLQDKRLASHIFKQWIAVHSFVAYQGLEESKIRRVLGSATAATSMPPVKTSAPDPSTLEPIRHEELLDLVNQSWEPFLRAYDSNREIVIGAISTPDYRLWSGSFAGDNFQPHHDQWLPLPVIVIEGLNQQMRLLRAYLDQAALAAYSSNPSATNAARDQALVRYGDTIRLGYLVEASAKNLYTSQNPDPNSLERWNAALEELHGLREDVRRMANGLAIGRNPLGIEEDDLPIFFGDPQGTNSQYFASSDYLVNQWAVPSVSAAEASITAARDAWLQARNSRIQDRMTLAQRDQRVDDLKAAQGQKLIANCGLTNMDAQDVLDAFEGGTADGTQLQLSTCFIDPTCLARSSLTPAALTARLTPQAVQFKLCTLNETAGYRHLPEPMATCAAIGSISGCEVVDLYNDYNSGLVPDDAVERANLVCQARLGFRSPLPTAQDFFGTDASCYRGKMGAAALQIVGARNDIDIAITNWTVAQQQFRLDLRYCAQVEQAEIDAEKRARALKQVQDKYEYLKLWAGGRANDYDAWTSAVSSGGNPISVVTSFLGGAQKNKVLEAQNAMDQAQEQYNFAMAIKQATDTIRACMHEVDKSNLAITTAFAQIARRYTDSASAFESLKTMMNENIQALRQGQNDVKREKDRFISTVAHHYWVSEKVEKFNKEFVWAKRMTYLAMRAVEYEFQQSLPLRQAVLTASHPDQLQDAIRALQQEVGTRTINRRRPSESSVVLSLRDEVLALSDHSADPAGERQLTPMRGLQQRLTDPRFAVHDRDGNWLGQGIPFNLGPEGALSYRCGERLWRITATVQGDGLSESQPGVSLMVMKRNTFASQWCEGEGDGSAFQYGSVQPSRRLFGEKGSGALESQANGFSTALLYPWFNIRRTDFYKDSYRDGASEELAGRGLYGDYILLFPRNVLEGTANETDACVAVRRGFPLDQVEDVLIRFDYLSVDNLPDLLQQ